jgi:glycosyltransferase involved in cell wall biosynthesis
MACHWNPVSGRMFLNNFENPPRISQKRTRIFRESIGLDPNDRMILQPTRIVQRKGIEFAIELVKELGDQRNKLVVSHEAGDEGMEYAEWLKEHACDHGVDLRMVSIRIDDPFNKNNGNGAAKYSLWDVYPYADFITFPSLYEGFGNAFLEGIYFKKPILINRYATFVRDIEPLGFDLAVMDGYLSKKTVQNVVELLESPQRTQKMVNNYYQIAARHYSYSVLRSQLTATIRMFFGDSVEPLTAKAFDSENDGYLYIDSQAIMYKRYDSRNCRARN